MKLFRKSSIQQILSLVILGMIMVTIDCGRSKGRRPITKQRMRATTMPMPQGTLERRKVELSGTLMAHDVSLESDTLSILSEPLLKSGRLRDDPVHESELDDDDQVASHLEHKSSSHLSTQFVRTIPI